MAKLRRDSQLNTWEWAERCFGAWKGYHAKAKYIATRSELDTERPRRMELEMQLSREQTDHHRSRAKAACRAVLRMQGGDLRSYFSKWAETAFYFRFNQVRVKNLVIKNYLEKIKAGLMRWRHNVYDDDIFVLHSRNEAKHTENEALAS
jgi:hypothetical protein